jgi:dipeptidyl aminopeptidase/acylaminoacyl peptidase
MPIGIRLLFAVICTAGWVLAQAAPVPFTDLARQYQYRDVKISPDGQHIAAVAVIKGESVLALVDLATGQGAAVHPRDGDQVVDFWWVNPNRVLYTVGLKWGGVDRPYATGEIFAVNADGRGARLLFGYRASGRSTGTHISHATSERASATLIDTLRDDENHVLIAVNDWDAGADGAFTQVMRMDVRDGATQSVIRSPLRNANFVTDQHGVTRFAMGSNGSARGQVFYRAGDGAPWSLLFSDDQERGIPWPQVFNRDGSRVLMSCNGPGKGNACFWDVATQKLGPPVWTSDVVDFDSLIESLDGHDLVGLGSMPGTPVVSAIVPEADTVKLIAKFSQQFPGESVSVVSRTHDGSKAVILVQSDRDPGTFYLWDTKGDKASVLLQRASWINPEVMASMQPVEFKARDGVTLHGYLSVPPGSEKAKHLPLVVLVHGGPFGIRDTWGYDPDVQVLATHGYAVLQVNYRGSGGYGHDFERSGYRQWGGAMQDDLTDATRWAIAQGLTDAGRLCIFGGSYGGYAALEGAVSQPDLYRCTIGYVGVYDLPAMFHESDISQSYAGRSYLDDALGSDMAMLAARSPVNQLDHLHASVMLIVGGEDKRVPPEQGLAMHQALLKRHIAHEWLYQSGEGHGFYTEANRTDMYMRIVAFLDRNIGPGAARPMHP